MKKGFPYQFGENVYHVQIRSSDRQNITALRIIAKEALEAGVPFPVEFRVWENVSVDLTAAEMVAVADMALTKVSEGYAVVWVLKDQTEAATTIAELPVVPGALFTL